MSSSCVSYISGISGPVCPPVLLHEQQWTCVLGSVCVSCVWVSDSAEVWHSRFLLNQFSVGAAPPLRTQTLAGRQPCGSVFVDMCTQTTQPLHTCLVLWIQWGQELFDTKLFGKFYHLQRTEVCIFFIIGTLQLWQINLEKKITLYQF